MLCILSSSGHYPDILIEVTQEDLDKIDKLEGRGYLFDTEEGRAFIKELKARPRVPMTEVCIYC